MLLRRVRSWGLRGRLLYTAAVSEGHTVWLVGMMGAGKSTVGPVLAARLHRAYVDTDAEIERSAGCSVAEIFDREGEAAFRARERELIDALAGSDAVVSLGGGAIAQAGMQERLARAGTVVYLRARADTLLARLGSCLDRPLLRDLPPAQREGRIAALLDARKGAYESAGIVVDTDAGRVPDLVEELLERLRNGGVA